MFEPIETERLRIRPYVVEDTSELFERRNDPEVAQYQDWSLPWPAERAAMITNELAAMAGPTDGDWWSAVVEGREGGGTYGDVSVRLTDERRTAEIGYTFAREHWGHGYAAEAVSALVEYLFVVEGVTRVWAMLHPENLASALLLERTGFLFEGHTKLSTWVGDEVSDDWIYGLVKEDWESWTDRPRTPPRDVKLVPIDAGNARAMERLKTNKTQEDFVARMEHSFADALFPEVVDGAPVVPWMRAIEADGELVGFVMIALVTEHHPEPYLWRFLIDRLHQRRGIGKMALELLYEEVRAMGHETIVTSWGEGKGSPEPFYRSEGFEPTGEMIDHEVEARKTFV